MKKHIMLFVILGAFFLCSCSSESQSNLPDNSRNESVQLNSNSLKMITSSWGAQEWCGTKDGFYYLNRADQNTYNISYIDYVSCVMTPLCSSPNCLHKDDTCSAYFHVPNCGAAVFTDGDYLYIMTFSDGTAERNNEFPRLYRIDKDGSNRKLLLELSQGETFSRYVAADETALYVNIVGSELNQQGISDVCIVQKVDINDGTAETILNLSTNAQLCGEHGDSLVFQSVDIPGELGDFDLKNIKNRLYEISLSTKQQKDILTWTNGESSCIIEGETIFSLDYSDSTINKRTIHNGETKNFVCQIPDDVVYDKCIFNYLDSQVLIFDLIEYGNPQTRRFAISLPNSQLHEITLGFLNSEVSYPYVVFSSTIDGLLVQCGTQQFEEEGIFSNGEMDTFTYTEPLFGIIKTSDYLNNENKIQEINRID